MILRYYIDNLVLNDDRSASNDQEVTKLYGMTTIRSTNFLRLFHHLEPKFHDISTKLISPFFMCNIKKLTMSDVLNAGAVTWVLVVM